MWRLFVVGIPIVLILFLLLHFFKTKHKLIFSISSFMPIAFIMYRLIFRAVVYDNIAYTLQGIPFQICGMSSILLIIIALTKNKVAFNLMYFITMPATIFAMILDDTVTTQGWNFNFWCFVVPHLMYLILPAFMLGFKYMKPEIKMIKWVLLTFAIVIIVMHCLNLTLNAIFPTENGFPTTNYIFTMYPGDCAGPPDYEYKQFAILKDVYKLVPIKCLYLFLLVPLLALVWVLLSVPLVVIKKVSAKKQSENIADTKSAV